jgi:FkbM family methyltransferase
MRLDVLAHTLAPPDAIKIDVEGAEMNVLRGAAAVIAKYRPPMMIEGPEQLWAEMV